jgi:cytochrome c
MKRSLLQIVVVAGLGLVSHGALADGAALAQKGGCMTCHGVDARKVGPAFKDISAKYKDQNAEDMLVKKVKEGGRGAWGPLPMPPNTGKLSDDEFKSVVTWIISL